MGRRLTAEAVLEELDQDDLDDFEPMMPGSDDEFSDLEDVEDEDDDIAAQPHLPPEDVPSSTSGTAGLQLSHPSHLAHQRSTSPSHQLTSSTLCSLQILWTTWWSRATCMLRRLVMVVTITLWLCNFAMFLIIRRV